MLTYALQRLVWLVPVLLFISIITFALMHAVEGGPWDEDRSVPASVTENLNRRYGLDQPIWRQYVDFVWSAFHGDLGLSYQHQDRPVTAIILSGFRVSAVLGMASLLVATTTGVTLGVFSALHRNRIPDYAGVLLASIGSAVPAFVLGIFLIYVFGVKLHALPSFGWDVRRGFIPGWLPPVEQMVLPVATLAALPAAYIARVTRAALLDVLGQDYVRTARAKGLAPLSVLLQHSLRNAAIPVLTVVGPITAGLVTGSFIVEHLFSVPGTGRLFVQSVNARDYGLIMGTTLFYAAVIVTANLIVDLAYALADPRVRYR